MARYQHNVDHSRDELPLWAERYARNRVLPVLVVLVIGAIYAAVVALGIAVLLRILARGDHPVLIGLAYIYNLAVVVAVCWMAVTGRLTKIYETFMGNLYRREGRAVPVAPLRVPKTTEKVVAMFFVLFAPWLWLLLMDLFLHVLHVSPSYLQPAMATVIVPVLVWHAITRADNPNWLGWIVPTLYTAHAVLVLSGLHLSLFGGNELTTHAHRWPTGNQIMDVFLPLCLYTLISLLTKHIYSRYAFLKLQVAALTPPSEIEDDDNEDDANVGA